MAMKKLVQFLALLICCAACNSCEREYPEIDFKLPAESQTGANTIGFLVNGKVWINYGQNCNIYGCDENLNSGYFHSGLEKNIFRILADMYVKEDKQEKLKQNIAIYRSGIDTTGSFLISNQHSNDYVVFYDFLTNKQYESRAEKPSFKLIITKIDTVSRIAAGRFEGVLYNPKDLKDSLVIKAGCFDVKLPE